MSRSASGNAPLSWHVINEVVGDGFDITMCQEMLVDHSVTIPLQLLWPDGNWPTIVPVAINTVQHPLPSMARCLELGRAVGRAIMSYPQDVKVVMIGTGGLSHQLDGKRAGSSTRTSTPCAWISSAAIRRHLRATRSATLLLENRPRAQRKAA